MSLEAQMATVDIAACWSRIERWLAANAPGAASGLPAGASRPAFARAEKVLGYPLPREVKESLALHDGSAHLWLHDRGEFLSLDGILSAWDQEFDLWGDGNNDACAAPRGPIKKKWFTRKWLPVLDARTGDYVCVDLDPPKGGKRGQLIAWYHDAGPTEVVAPSFGVLLQRFAQDLEAGRYAAKVNRQGAPYLAYAAVSAEPASRWCTGTRKGRPCGQFLYRCKNCGKVGCQRRLAGECSNQGFSGRLGTNKCLGCRKSGQREPFDPNG